MILYFFFHFKLSTNKRDDSNNCVTLTCTEFGTRYVISKTVLDVYNIKKYI